jgi:hypothetical protein
MKAILFLAAFAVFTTLAPAAGPAPKADGNFTSRDLTMPVSTAMAFRAKSSLDQQDVIPTSRCASSRASAKATMRCS